MIAEVRCSTAEAWRWNGRELAGGLADLGTFLPLTLALALATQMDLGWMLVGAGLMNIVTGLWFRQPIPVQPMKAIAAVAIADSLLADQVVAAGLWMGLILLVLAWTGWIDRIVRQVPRPVVRAIQLAIGLKLIVRGLAPVGVLPGVGLDSLLVMGLASGALVIGGWWRRPPIVTLVVAGLGLAMIASPWPTGGWEVGLRLPVLHIPDLDAWQSGFVLGALPQLPLTLLNSVAALCLLSADYYPDRPARPRSVAWSVAVMNLLCVPWAGLPMCHGSGGLAAQYGGGARTGASVIMLGLLKLAVGLGLGATLAMLLTHFPLAILSVLVLFAGTMLARAGVTDRDGRSLVILIVTTAMILALGSLVGVVLGLVVTTIVDLAIRRFQALAPRP